MAAGEDVREMIAGIEARDGVTTTPAERLLLATDGTVTHMLEALTRTPVEVDILDRKANQGRLTRKVALRRATDGSALAYAKSKVDLFPIEMEMEDRLVNGDIGIGDLLREEYTETRRKITSMDAVWVDTADCPPFVPDGVPLYLHREYEIYSDDSRIMQIGEWFPKGMF